LEEKQDAKLRKEFYRSAASQLRPLKGIGISEMEGELEKKVKTIGKSPGFLEETPKWDLEEEGMKQTSSINFSPHLFLYSR
jgi:hypothetical protein